MAFRRLNEALLSITTRRVGRTVKTRFIPGSLNATDRCHVIVTPEKRLRGKWWRPVSKAPSTSRPRFNRIVIKLPSIRTNARTNVFSMKKLACLPEENRKYHLSSPLQGNLTISGICRGEFVKWNLSKKDWTLLLIL